MKLIDLFKTKNGQIVIAQFPNPPLFIAALFFALRFTEQGVLISIGNWGVIITMLYWSYLEITQGVNTWRKFLGLSIAVYFLYQLLQLLLS